MKSNSASKNSWVVILFFPMKLRKLLLSKIAEKQQLITRGTYHWKSIPVKPFSMEKDP